jgi:DNA mismatch repair protein PMS2
MINEFYRTTALIQYPFFMLNLEMNPQDYDVNLTPDKRQIFLHNEKEVLQFVRTKMELFFGLFEGRLRVSESSQRPSLEESPPSWMPSEVVLSSSTSLPPEASLNNSSLLLSSHNPEPFCSEKETNVNMARLSQAPQLAHHDSNFRTRETTLVGENTNVSSVRASLQPDGPHTDPSAKCPEPPIVPENSIRNQRIAYEFDLAAVQNRFRSYHSSAHIFLARSTATFDESLCLNRSISLSSVGTGSPAGIHQLHADVAESELSRIINKEDFETMEVVGQFNLGFIIVKRKKNIDKEMVNSCGMLDNFDLFIVDQHAADEKYNFEKFMKETILESQPLIQPLLLELSPSEETIIAENLAIFEKNGFQFDVDMSREPTKRVQLICQPYSKSITFGKPDIEELIATIIESDGLSTSSLHTDSLTTLRCSRVRAMLASRACRKSVMIGMPLEHKQMIRVNRIS